MSTNRLGGLWDGETKHQAGSIWDIYNDSPTIDTMLGGGREPHIIEVEKLEIKELGGLEEGSNQRRKVFDENGVSPTLQAAMGSGGGNVPMVTTVEAVIGGMQKNQMVGNGDYCSSLTASMGTGGGYVPMVVEKTEIMEFGYLEKGTGKHQSNVVYDKDGLSPCICAGIGVKQQPTMTIEQTCVAMRGRNPENPSDRTKGIKLEQKLEPNSQGLLNTLTSVQKDNLVLEKQKVEVPKKIKIRQATKQGFIECEIGGAVDLDYPSSQTRRARVIEEGKLSPTLTTENIPNVIELGNPDFYNFLYEIDGEIYLIRIRKLIPLECWRLMGFTDEDFYKAEKVNSNTQLYKQAGNSIVTNCLEALFSQMNINGVKPWNEKIKETV